MNKDEFFNSDVVLSCFDGLSNVHPVNITFQRLLNLVKTNPEIAHHTTLHRQYLKEGKKQAADREKKASPCVSVSVTFSDGKDKAHIESWTSLGMVDLDHVPAERMAEVLRLIRSDEHTLLCFTTISGEGIRILYRYNGLTDDASVNEKVHEVVFQAINRHYARLTGCKTDGKCKNATRLTVLAHDPEVYYNPQATECCYAKLQAACDDEKKNQQQKKGLRRQLATAVRAAEAELRNRDVQYAPHHHDEYIYQMGLLLNEYGADCETAVAWAAQRFEDYPDAPRILRHCFKDTSKHGTRTPKDNSRKECISLTRLKEYLDKQAAFRKNTVTGFTEIAYHTEQPEWQDLTDRDLNSFWHHINEEISYCSLSDIRQLLESDYVPLFNPFTSCLSSYDEWDGQTDYIDQLASMVHAKTPEEDRFFHHYFKKWFVAMVASLLKEKVVNHKILVLIGRQGIFKTSWLNKLLPPELNRYFSLKCNNHHFTKDDHLALSEFALICLEELDNLEGAVMTQLKALTTLPHITERAPYARYKEVRPHLASLAGTSNQHQFLSDPEGTRRWLPVDVESIDDPHTHPINYAGIYAQAVSLVKQDYHYWLSPEETREVNEHNRDFEMPCVERDLIQTYFRRPMPHEKGVFMTNAEILKVLQEGPHITLSILKVSVEMKALGYKPIKINGKRGYRVIRLTAEEVEFNRHSLARDCTESMDSAE